MQPSTRPWWLTFCSKHLKTKYPKFTPLSETTSIPICIIWNSTLGIIARHCQQKFEYLYLPKKFWHSSRQVGRTWAPKEIVNIIELPGSFHRCLLPWPVNQWKLRNCNTPWIVFSIIWVLDTWQNDGKGVDCKQSLFCSKISWKEREKASVINKWWNCE